MRRAWSATRPHIKLSQVGAALLSDGFICIRVGVLRHGEQKSTKLVGLMCVFDVMELLKQPLLLTSLYISKLFL
jgi:hypothetical protein